jgi:diguanylate cyclase (GGDEF)-like protein
MSSYVDNVIDDLDRQILFNMPLRKAIILFSALLFTIITLSSSVAYYFSMRKILSENLAQELKQTLDMRYFLLRAELKKKSTLLKALSEYPDIKAYFSNPNDEKAKKPGLDVFEQYKNYFNSKMIGWIGISDSNYYVNGQFMEKYSGSNPKHAWFFEVLKSENVPTIRVDFDYLNRQIYDLYLNYPVYSEGKVIGVISGRISLFEFVNRLHIPENIFVFDNNGIVIGAADEKIAKEKKTLKELFGKQGDEVLKTALSLGKKSNKTFNIGRTQYVVKSTERLDLFLMAKDSVDISKILEERASIVFAALLLLMLLVFAIFNRLISHMLEPINRNMMSYIKSSLLDELTKLPNRRFFNMRIEDEWNRAVRGKYSLSFLMMDLDNFKIYNDTNGHLEGDRLLRDVARIFSFCVNRTSDFVARFGGEEFSVVLPNTKLEGAKKIAENIRMSMERAGKATISIGLVCKAPALNDNMQEFIDKADQKLYEAKNTGKNKVCL